MLTQLEPVVERLLTRHLESAREWFPHELIPYDRGRTFEPGAIDLLLPVRLIAHRFGGSHAQRDVIGLTLLESALRAGRRNLAIALTAERAALKPISPSLHRLVQRADSCRP